MLNCAIYKTETGQIVDFIRDCTRDGNNFTGSNVRLFGRKLTGLSVRWTEDDAVPVVNPDGEITGWIPATVDQLIEGAGVRPEIVKMDQASIAALIIRLKDIVGMTFQELDDHIDTAVTDLPSAKVYIRRLSKVVLALGKILEQKL